MQKAEERCYQQEQGKQGTLRWLTQPPVIVWEGARRGVEKTWLTVAGVRLRWLSGPRTESQSKVGRGGSGA